MARTTVDDRQYGPRIRRTMYGRFLVASEYFTDLGVWVTCVIGLVGDDWRPLEYHHSDTEAAARETHDAAMGRHPIDGPAQTLPRGVTADDRCSRCGEHIADPHHPLCRS